MYKELLKYKFNWTRKPNYLSLLFTGWL